MPKLVYGLLFTVYRTKKTVNCSPRLSPRLRLVGAGASEAGQQGRGGFSLIEVLLFLLIVLVLVTILLTSASNLSKTRQVNLDSIASEISSCEIEQLRKKGVNP